MPRNVLNSSLYGAGYDIIFQIVCRAMTFGINAYIVRNIGREVLGIMNVRLLLLESTLLFLSREAIHRASLSAVSHGQEKCSWAQLINQQWLTVVICIVVNIPCLYIWLYWLSTVDNTLWSQYRFACYAVGLSCIIELCAEAPLFIGQVFCFVRLKIICSTLHIFVRSCVFLSIVLSDVSLAIEAFAIAQLSSAVTIIISYYGFFAYYIMYINNLRKKDDSLQTMTDFPFQKFTEFLPGVLENKNKFFNSELQVLTLSFIKQEVLKQILTEGEKYVMSVSPVLNFKEQATYDVVNNLGSLVARFIFRPIEESSYFYFSQTISRNAPLMEQPKHKVLEANQVLKYVSLVVSSIGLLVLVYGQSYAHLVLHLYGGEKFVSDNLPIILLRWHCVAISFIAVNGITEAYMLATNSNRDIEKYNYVLAIFSINFLIMSYVLTSIFGPVGFIFANCFNMICRICYSTHFISRQYHPLTISNPLTGLIPGKVFITVLLISGFLCKYSMENVSSLAVHILIGVISIFITLIIWSAENIKIFHSALLYREKMKYLK